MQHQIVNYSVNRFISYEGSKRLISTLYLVPERCTDDTIALEHFTRVFHARYGSTGPILYIGSLEKAIQESLHTSINDVNQYLCLF